MASCTSILQEKTHVPHKRPFTETASLDLFPESYSPRLGQPGRYILLCIYNAFCITLLVPAQVAVFHQMNNLYRHVTAITGLISSTSVGCVSLWELSSLPLDKSALTSDVCGAIFIPVWLANYPEVIGCWRQERENCWWEMYSGCLCVCILCEVWLIDAASTLHLYPTYSELVKFRKNECGKTQKEREHDRRDMVEDYGEVSSYI